MSQIPGYMVPTNFGSRHCDIRFIQAVLEELGCSSLEARGLLFGIWHVVGVDPSSELVGPQDREKWEEGEVARLVESLAGYEARDGRLFALAVDSGVFQVVPMPEGKARFVLRDFAAVNRASHSLVSALGGISKSMNRATKEAEHDARQMMDLFSRTGDEVLSAHSPDQVRKAVVFIRQINRLMKWPDKTDGHYMATMVPHALAALSKLGGDKDVFLQWLVAARDSGKVPPRIDAVLGEIQSLRGLATEWRRSLL